MTKHPQRSSEEVPPIEIIAEQFRTRSHVQLTLYGALMAIITGATLGLFIGLWVK